MSWIEPAKGPGPYYFRYWMDDGKKSPRICLGNDRQIAKEFNLDVNFDSFEIMEKSVIQSIALYNQLRPHQSINMLTPDKAHSQCQIKLKTWKKRTLLV